MVLVWVVAVKRLGLLLRFENSQDAFHRTATVAERDIGPIGFTDDIRLGQPIYSVRHVARHGNSLHQGFFNNRQAISIGSPVMMRSSVMSYW